MEISLITKKVQSFAFAMLALLMSITASAQEAVDSKVTTTTKTTHTEEWYANPTYIIIGAVLFIVLIAVLVMGGRRGRD